MGFISRALAKADGSKTGLGNAAEKFGLSGLLDDTANAIDNTLNGIGSSIGDLAKSKKQRNNKENVNESHFTQEEVSLANRHHDEITNILSGVVNGNLLDAGLDALNLYNFGTKWWIYTDQQVDKEIYPFKYYYYKTDKDVAGLTNSETGVPDISVLDSIEDPTVLGYTLKVDFKNSPLFVDDNTSFDGSNLRSFITQYGQYYPEIENCKKLLDEFQAMFKLVFESMESLQSNKTYRSRPYKQHYITKIEGLGKLENPFVEVKEDGDEELKITLYEDVRMFTTRMAMLYKNLTYSYNMGKKLIPANLLRFNLYIKISEQRPFTSGNNEKDRYRDAIRNGYSRVIYELRDCELAFGTAVNETISVGGFGSGGEGLATLPMTIKYKKVNRIFYSALFKKDMEEYVLGDKYLVNDDDKIRAFVKATGFEGRMRIDTSDPSKRPATSNNIDVVPSLRERYSNLKNNGLFTGEDNDDSAITRFIKTQANNAVTKGMSFVDEGLDKLRDKIDDAGLSIRDRLRLAINNKTVNLGRVYTKDKDAIALPEGGNINAGSVDLPLDPIKEIRLYDDQNDNITSPNSNVNANELSYFSQQQIGVNYLQVPYNNQQQIGVSYLQVPYNNQQQIGVEYLQQADPVNHALPVEDLMVGDAVNHALTVEDLMVGDAVNHALAVEDLMVGQPVNHALAVEDIMVGEPVNHALPVEDLMVGDVVNHALAIEDIMVGQPVNHALAVEDIMVAGPVEEPKPLPNEMVATPVQHTLDVVDIMVPVDTNPALEKVDLMVPGPVADKSDSTDLMVPDTYTVTRPTGNLMQADEVPVAAPAQDLDNKPAPAPGAFVKKFLK